MLQLTVVRWKRFGHDRLYANLPDGTAAGWADCTTGTITVLLTDYLGPVTSVLAPHLPGNRPDSPATDAPSHAGAPLREGASSRAGGRSSEGEPSRAEAPFRGGVLSRGGAPFPEGMASHGGAPSRRTVPDFRGRQDGLRKAPTPEAAPAAPTSKAGSIEEVETPHLMAPASPATPPTPMTSLLPPLTPLLPPLTPLDDLAANAPGTALRPRTDESSAGPVARALARILGRPADEDSWRKGAGGERRVGAELDRLRRHGWHVLHSIPLPGDVDLDHLLIGPGGVFSINTKNHPGKPVWVGDDAVKVDDGEPRPYARRSRSEAERVQRVLGHYCGFTVPVDPVLVFVGITDLKVEATQLRVRVYREREVSSLAPLTGVWTPAQVTHIHSIARHRRTWLEA
ncbi:nuclease-related domain-containing protein [Streptomyces sp. NPDC059271]|uniref:nuclease-related domain-containing protein n=1 Tax=Streptomyces sp. NPDC059271 TaxID=3346799 RepID=UPI00368ACB08